jgi:hypothetical protein
MCQVLGRAILYPRDRQRYAELGVSEQSRIVPGFRARPTARHPPRHRRGQALSLAGELEDSEILRKLELRK